MLYTLFEHIESS